MHPEVQDDYCKVDSSHSSVIAHQGGELAALSIKTPSTSQPLLHNCLHAITHSAQNASLPSDSRSLLPANCSSSAISDSQSESESPNGCAPGAAAHALG
jgi:hypothetical protein